MGRVAWRGAGVVGGVLAVVLGGCTGSAQPAVTTPPVAATSVAPSPTATPTPSPSVDVAVPPVRPEAMATPSAGGAAAAASYFISLYAYIYATGDFVEWDALASPECEFCGGVRNDVEQLHVQGRRSVVEVAVTSSDGLEVDAARWYSADLHVRVSPASDFDADGNQVGSREAEEHEVTVLLTWSGGWIIDEVGPDMKMGG